MRVQELRGVKEKLGAMFLDINIDDSISVRTV